jgi:cobalt/nickel transport system permease protein
VSHFHWDNLAYLDGPLHRMDARVKVLSALLLLLLAVTLPPQRPWAFFGFTLLWALLWFCSKVPWKRMVTGLLLVSPFIAMTTLFWLLPGSSPAQRELYLSAAAKSVLGILMVAMLASTTRFADLLEALRRLKVPPLLVRLLGLTYRFLFVFTEEASRMRRSLAARAFEGRWLGHVPVLGRMLGVLFLRAYERGERVHLAMAARGYGQEPPPPPSPRAGLRDVLSACLVLASAAALRFFA